MANVIKPMTVDEMILALDRISRFKFPEKKLKRVYVETICSNLISPSLKKVDIEKFDNKSLSELFCEIWNYSISFNFKTSNKNYELNKNYIEQEKKCYFLTKDIIDLMPKTADFLTLVNNIKKVPNNFNDYKTPQKIVLTEGITEEILLPKFSQIYEYDWDKNNIKIVGIGGKSRIIKFYETYKEQIRVPVFILLDKDAKSIFDELVKKLRPIDNAHLIEHGEIEDIIPVNLFKNAINSEFKQQVKISVKDFSSKNSMVENLHKIFYENGLGEFKKAKMAQMILTSFSSKTVFTQELMDIMNEIKNL